MVGLCEGGNEHPGYLACEGNEGDNASEMSPGFSTESYPTCARIGLRENPGKNLNQVTCPDQDSNPGHLVSRPDALTITPQDQKRCIDISIAVKGPDSIVGQVFFPVIDIPLTIEEEINWSQLSASEEMGAVIIIAAHHRFFKEGQIRIVNYMSCPHRFFKLVDTVGNEPTILHPRTARMETGPVGGQLRHHTFLPLRKQSSVFREVQEVLSTVKVGGLRLRKEEASTSCRSVIPYGSARFLDDEDIFERGHGFR
ncbi:hypothetical protein ANN_17035 [Periplaneta americana]|uniref:Uncharacterized protein n=1 Tax=Periplaneta americana TaxID=6978 RepID=A0ABQ8SRS2_PERAM|nr:hypothetical protein ANN_17035 [Periplaneta americana]